jgi:hypothetical protein
MLVICQLLSIEHWQTATERSGGCEDVIVRRIHELLINILDKVVLYP